MFVNPRFAHKLSSGQTGITLTPAEYALFLELLNLLSSLDPNQVVVNGVGVNIGLDPVVITTTYSVMIGLDRIVVGPQLMVMTNG